MCDVTYRNTRYSEFFWLFSNVGFLETVSWGIKNDADTVVRLCANRGCLNQIPIVDNFYYMVLCSLCRINRYHKSKLKSVAASMPDMFLYAFRFISLKSFLHRSKMQFKIDYWINFPPSMRRGFKWATQCWTLSEPPVRASKYSK